MSIKTHPLVDSRSTPPQSRNSLLQANNTRHRHLRQDTLQDGLIDTHIRPRLNDIIRNNVDLVIEIKQPHRRADNDTRRPDPRQHHRIDSLRTQNLLEPIPSTGVIPRLLQHDVVGVVVLEGRVDLALEGGRGDVAEAGGGGGEGGGRPDFGALGSGEVDAGVD